MRSSTDRDDENGYLLGADDDRQQLLAEAVLRRLVVPLADCDQCIQAVATLHQ
jgi:hypothetical protein